MIFYMLFLYTSVLGLGLGKILTSGLSKFSSGGDSKIHVMKLFVSTQMVADINKMKNVLSVSCEKNWYAHRIHRKHLEYSSFYLCQVPIHSFWYPNKIHTHIMRSVGLQDYRVYLTMKLQSQKIMLWFTRHSPMSIEIINAWWHQIDACNVLLQFCSYEMFVK